MDEQKVYVAPDKTADQDHIAHGRFLRRLRISHRVPKFPIRNWMSWLGVAMLIAMIIVYYATGGAG